MSEINPLNSAGQVIRTNQFSISQELNYTIAHPRPKTEDIELRSMETTILTKENSPDKTKGVASNDGKSVEDLKTEHDSKKEALGKLTIFEKIKLGWKKLPLFEKIAADLLIASSVALAIMVSAPLAGMLAIGTIVYIAKDVQNAYNTEKLKIEAEYLGNLNKNLQASSEKLETNLKKAEEANKELEGNLDNLKKDFNKIQNEAGKAKENIDNLEIQQKHDENVKIGLIDNILNVYESILKAQQDPISKLKSTNENFNKISKSNDEISFKAKEITSISSEITSEINNFCSSIFGNTQKTDTNNRTTESNLSEKIDKEILSKKLGELSKKDLVSILNQAINLNTSILGKTNKINKLSLEIQTECQKITENSNAIKGIVNNVIKSLTETQKEYEETLINVAKKVLIETKNSDDKKWWFSKKDIDALKGKIQGNNKINKNLIEKLNNNNLNELKLSSEEAILILNAYKDKISTDKNKDWEKASKNIEDFINGFTENGKIMQQLQKEASNIENNIGSIGSSIENSMQIIADINKISGEITAVSKNLKDLIGPNASSLITVASLGIALGGLASMAVSAPVVAGIGGLLAIESAAGIASKCISIVKNKISAQ